MKINILDAHDRLLDFKKKNSLDIGECCQDLINQRPFGEHPFYIFVHPRTDDDGINKRFIWSPWIYKPRAQTNSMLFKGYPGKDEILFIWDIPDRILWPQYAKGNLLESSLIANSVYLFEHDRKTLEKPEPDDPSPERAQEIVFEYFPLLFKRDTLSSEKQAIWDKAKRKKEEKNQTFKMV